MLLTLVGAAHAVDVYQNFSMSINSDWTSSTAWVPQGAPAPGNVYWVGTMADGVTRTPGYTGGRICCRTPLNVPSIFNGDRLIINGTSATLALEASNGQTVTISDLRMRGDRPEIQFYNSGLIHLAGTVTNEAAPAGYMRFGRMTVNFQRHFVLDAKLTGAGNIRVEGGDWALGFADYALELNNDANDFTGRIYTYLNAKIIVNQPHALGNVSTITLYSRGQLDCKAEVNMPSTTLCVQPGSKWTIEANQAYKAVLLPGGQLQPGVYNGANLATSYPTLIAASGTSPTVTVLTGGDFDTTAPTVPGTPIGPAVVLDTTAVNFNWAASTDPGGSGPISYECQVGTAPGTSNVFFDNVGFVLNKTVNGQMGRNYCRVRAIDAVGNVSPWSANSAGTFIDTPPNAPAVTISPASPGVLDNIVANVDASDPDPGDSIAEYRYEWSLNGIIQSTSSTLPAGLTVKGQQWSLSAWARDSYGMWSKPGTLTLDSGDNNLQSAAIDPAGGFAYFGTGTSPGKIIKVRLSDFTGVGTLTLATGENYLRCAAIDPVGGFAYFGTSTFPGKIIKVRLSDFTEVGTLTLATGENYLYCAVIDPAGGFAYFGTGNSSKIIKVRLSDFTEVSSLTFATMENSLSCAAIDPAGGFAYFGAYTYPGKVIKVHLSDFTEETLTLATGENYLESAAIDPAGGFAYFGAGKIIKVHLSDFTEVGTLTLAAGENNLHLRSAAIDSAGGFAYFGTGTSPGRIIKVRLSDFTQVPSLALVTGENNLYSAAIDPAGGFVYFGTDTSPGKIIKVRLSDFAAFGTRQFTIANTPPTQPIVDIRPQPAQAGQDIVCDIQQYSTDADGDEVAYDFQWFKSTNNGLSWIHKTELDHQPQVSGGFILNGDLWEVHYIPYEKNSVVPKIQSSSVPALAGTESRLKAGHPYSEKPLSASRVEGQYGWDRAYIGTNNPPKLALEAALAQRQAGGPWLQIGWNFSDPDKDNCTIDLEWTNPAQVKYLPLKTGLSARAGGWGGIVAGLPLDRPLTVRAVIRDAKGAITQALLGPVQPLAPSPGVIASYLVGKSADKTGMDANVDGKITVADVVRSSNSGPPYFPAAPSPADNAKTVSLTPTLDWGSCPHATSYQLYLWPANTTRPTIPTVSALASSAYTIPTPLTPNTAYWWQVVAVNGTLKTNGPVWAFTTKQ